MLHIVILYCNNILQYNTDDDEYGKTMTMMMMMMRQVHLLADE